MIFDLAIVGGGPAGIAAGIYAARKHLRTVFLTADWGGQSSISPQIENWVGEKSIMGLDLAQKLRDHLESYKGEYLNIVDGVWVTKVEKKENNFLVSSQDGTTQEARAVLLSLGGRRRKLEVPGAKEFDQKGITYCASCDGPLFSGTDVAVIGGGNAGFETVAQLSAYTKHITLLHKNPEFKADPQTVEKVLQDPKVTPVLNAQLLSIEGDKFVTGLTYKNKTTGEVVSLPVKGIFAEIGFIPNTDCVKGLVDLNQYGAIITDPKNQRTSVAGIWAAGDCSDALYHQNNIAAGDAVKALEDTYLYLHTSK